MELRQLEHFVAVAEELHFSRAAARLHIVQSGLSSSVRSLERELGAELFVRTTRQVELTEAGRALLPEARQTLTAARAAREAVSAVEGLLRGTVSVGIMQVQEPLDLPAMLGRFRREHPAVEVHLRQAAAASLLDAVRRGELDLTFSAVTEPDPSGVDFRLLARQDLVVACARRHPLAAASVVELAELGDEEFVEFPPDWGVRIEVDRAFAAAGIQRRIGFELNDVRTLLALVAAGLGISVVPEWAASYRIPVTLVPLRPSLAWELYLVTRTGTRPSAAARALISLLPEPADGVAVSLGAGGLM